MSSIIGTFVVAKYRHLAAKSGVQHAARLLRKQGYPIHMALAILAGRI
jgi:hypothetical protein